MKRSMFLAVLCVLITLCANAQKTKKSKNLRDDTPWEVFVKGQYALTGPNGGGIAMGFDKYFQMNKSGTVALGFGATAAQTYTKTWGAMTDAYLTGGVRLGKKVGIQPTILFGLGAMGYTDHCSNGVDRVVYDGTVTKPLLGGGLEAFFWVSQRIKVSAAFSYAYYINTGNRQYEQPEGWTHEPTEFHQSKAQVELKISRTLGGGQVHGDNDWRIMPVVGYALGENSGFAFATEFYQSKRLNNPFLRRVLGGGFSEKFSGGKTFTEIYGKAGLQWEPWGANSSVLFNFGVMPGLTEALKYEEAATETGSYYMNSRVQVPALTIKGYAEMEIPFGERNTVRGIVGFRYGMDVNFQTTYNYSKNTSGSVHGAGSVYAGLAIAL